MAVCIAVLTVNISQTNSQTYGLTDIHADKTYILSLLVGD